MSTITHSKEMIHPRLVRLTHWVNAVAMIIMIMSGLQIYNAYPILPFTFPQWMTLGGWLGGALLWHFAAMWLLAGNFALYVGYGLWSGRFAARLVPIGPKAVIRDMRDAFSGDLAHHDLSRYNAVQKLLYTGVIVAIAIAILSGLALWKPVQLQGLTGVFGGFERARIVHFLSMLAITGFIIIHVTMALLVPTSLRAMIRGR